MEAEVLEFFYGNQNLIDVFAITCDAFGISEEQLDAILKIDDECDGFGNYV